MGITRNIEQMEACKRAIHAHPYATSTHIASVLGIRHNAARALLRRMQNRGIIDWSTDRGWFVILNPQGAHE